jgi:hypothetical protein
MNVQHVEILYIERRIQDTLGMAAACTSSCGKRAHLELADLYTLKLQGLRCSYMPAPSIMESLSPLGSRQVRRDLAASRRAKTPRSATETFARQTGTLSLVVGTATKHA